MPEPHPNNPYARPINATKESAMLIGEFYGQRSTDKRRSHETGGRDVTPANRFQSTVTAVPAWPDEQPAPKRRSRPPKAATAPEPAITEEDLFG